MTPDRGFVHEALVYDDDHLVVDQLADQIEHDLRAGAHVLAWLPERLEAPLRSLVGAQQGAVGFRTVGDRYARPVDAIELVWAATRDELAAGARSLTSIGEIPIPEGDDPMWLWYEYAVNDVLRDLPLRGLCLIDRRWRPSFSLQPMIDAHQPHAVTPPMPGVATPTSPATHVVTVDAPAQARALLDIVTRPYGRHVADSAIIIVSELVTNAVNHGRTDASVSIWCLDTGLLLEVADHGPGLADAAAALRPPQPPGHRAGLWVCHQLADAFSVRPSCTGGTVARALLGVPPRPI